MKQERRSALACIMEELIQCFVKQAEGRGGEVWLRHYLEIPVEGEDQREVAAAEEGDLQQHVDGGVARPSPRRLTRWIIPPEHPAREEEECPMPGGSAEAVGGEVEPGRRPW